jgi:hypothetical protein
MRTIVWVAVLLAAGVAQAQQNQGSNGARAANDRAVGATSDAFDRACIDLLNGKTPKDEKAIRSLKDACANLMSGRADERLDVMKQRQAQERAREQLKLAAEGRQASVQPGQSSAPAEQGKGVLAAFGQAASELTGRSAGQPGMLRRGPSSWSLYTNPIGWFTGLGVNAQLFHAFEDAPKFSWVAGARYAAADATNGTASTFGAMGGADWFILGGNNAGLRIGPRVELAAGRERFGSGSDTNTFARLGMSGELGYNFLASNGISGMAAVGVGGRVAGDSKNESFASFVGGEFGPYLSVGLGYSW